MNANRTIGPGAEPISLTQAKEHLVVEHDEDDGKIMGHIIGAREFAEELTRRALITQTWQLTLPCFRWEIEIPRPPLQAIAKIEYLDEAQNLQLVSPSNYEVNTFDTVGRVRPVFGENWPATGSAYDAVRITYTAGYGVDGGSVPASILAGMLIHITDLYEMRGGTVIGASVAETGAATRLIKPYRVYSL